MLVSELGNTARVGCPAICGEYGPHHGEEMDEILVLEGGRIVGRGTHKELEGNHGFYCRMLDVQRELLAAP
jgi:hypothetical protein